MIDIRRDELIRIGLLWMQSLFIGLSIVCYESAATSLFLNVFDVSSLPLVYIGVAVVSVLMGLIYLRLERVLTPNRLFPIAVSFILIGVLCARGMIMFVDSKWIYMAIMIWLDVAIVFLAMQFWSLAGLLFTVRQSKRLFGIVSSGEVIGIVLGGMMMPLLVIMIGTPNIFILVAISLSLELIFLLFTLNHCRDRMKLELEDKDEALPIKDMFKHPYLRVVFVFILFYVMSDYFVDFFFYSKIDVEFTDQNKLTAFLGTFFAVVGGVCFFAKVFLFNRVLKRFGILGGLLIMPIMVLVSISLFLVSSNFFPNIEIFSYSGVFIFILLTKLLDLGLRPSIQEPTISILLQPFAPNRRVRIESFCRSVIDPISNGITGIMLLVLSLILGWGITEIGWATGGIFLAWIFLCIALKKGYTKELTQSFKKRQIAQLELGVSQVDRNSLLEYLDNNEAGSVIYVLRLLVNNDGEDCNDNVLQKALEHPHPKVKQEALRLMRDYPKKLYINIVKSLLETSQDPILQSEALMTFCCLMGEESTDTASSFIKHKIANVNAAAITGLIRYGGIAGALIAEDELQGLLTASDPSHRRLAAKILGDIGITSFYQPLLKLLQDKDISVLHESILCAGRLKNLQLVDSLLLLLSNPLLRQDIISALSKIGKDTFPYLKQWFNDADTNSYTSIGIIMALGHIGGDEVSKFLFNELEQANLDLRSAICESLAKTNSKVSEEMRSYIANLALKELKLSIHNKPGLSLKKYQPVLARVLEEEMETAVFRALHLLSTLDKTNSIKEAYTRYHLKSENQSAIAIEILDNVLHGNLRLKVSEAFEKLESVIKNTQSETDVILDILGRSDKDVGFLQKQ